MLERIRVILVQNSHPGNIGSAARALKNMGLSKLWLVSPLRFPSEEATAFASHANDILKNAMVVQTLEQALAGCSLVLGTSARTRALDWPTLSSKKAASKILEALRFSAEDGEVAILFGREQHGLSNEELAYCHYQINIPANPAYASLNVAQAVQVMSYEIYTQFIELSAQDSVPMSIGSVRQETQQSFTQEQNTSALETDPLVTADEMVLFFNALQETLVQIHFLDLEKPGHLMTRLRRLFAKTGLTKTELNILRGILTSIQKQV